MTDFENIKCDVANLIPFSESTYSLKEVGLINKGANWAAVVTFMILVLLYWIIYLL